jgi:undecaprenyl-phosphate 4-deoxy-4-formamido-L-arabinose transferase
VATARRSDRGALGLSVVIPVYRGAQTLRAVVTELLALTQPTRTAAGVDYRITEILLVDDRGPDGSAAVIRALEAEHPEVRAVWLSRNFGQHAATLAGIASSTGEWIVTMDEDGQHDPADIGALLDAAMSAGAQVAYADPRNVAPHGALRNAASGIAKHLARWITESSKGPRYSSFRLLSGAVARALAARIGGEVYLDVALGWVVERYATAPTTLRGEARPSGYTIISLLAHFRRLLISGGTRGLRLVSGLGILFAMGGVVGAVVVVVQAVAGGIDVPGWASTMVALFVTSGAILFSLGVVAEYIGVSVHAAMGKPGYLVVRDPMAGGTAAEQDGGREPRW